jgi:ankyrin repeat protein
VIYTHEYFSSEMKENYFGTGLHWAALSGQLEVIKYLVTFPEVDIFAEVNLVFF